MFKLALNAGHGYNTPGKCCLKSLDPNETKEYILNKRVCDKIHNKLISYPGIELLRIDDGSELSISARATKANKWGADFYLAIHHNAGLLGKSGGGIMAYTYLKVNDTTAAWQKDLYTALIKHTGLKGNRSQSLGKADFGECRETLMPAVLLECGFMDSPDDTPVILTEEYADKVAAACVEVILNHAGINAVPSESAPVVTAPAAKSNDDIAREVIAGKWGNGDARKQALIKAGYDYSAIQTAVNALCGAKVPARKSNTEIAKEVIAGKWGNGAARKARLKAAGYDCNVIQALVNKMC